MKMNYTAIKNGFRKAVIGGLAGLVIASTSFANAETKVCYKPNSNIEICLVDYNADGKPDKIWIHEYDSKGNIIKITYDYNADGKADEIWTYEYDSKGNEIKRTYDYNADGKADWIKTYE